MATPDALARHTWPCERTDSFPIADFQRLAGKPHDYPTGATEPRRCARCGNELEDQSRTYCSDVCGRKAGPLAGKYREGLQTAAGYSFAPPMVR